VPTRSDDVFEEEASGISMRRPRRRFLILASGVAIPALALALWWFQPQSLLFDDVVDDSFPIIGAPDHDDDTVSDEVESNPGGPVDLATGSFVSRNRYTVTGTATTYQLTDGQRILRLQDFESTNGPDLYVYLTVAGAGDDDAALAADFIDLGVLSGNIGNQNYVIPAEVDLALYDTVVIWCRRFTTSFGVADLI